MPNNWKAIRNKDIAANTLATLLQRKDKFYIELRLQTALDINGLKIVRMNQAELERRRMQNPHAFIGGRSGQ